MTSNTLYSFAQSLSTETGIDLDSATKVINWLITEGVLDFPVVNDTYSEQDPLGSNDNVETLHVA